MSKGNGTDTLGFSALPGGEYFNGEFSDAGGNGYWWSATPATVLDDDSYAYYLSMTDDNNVIWEKYTKVHLLSVRCLKNI